MLFALAFTAGMRTPCNDGLCGTAPSYAAGAKLRLDGDVCLRDVLKTTAARSPNAGFVVYEASLPQRNDEGCLDPSKLYPGPRSEFPLGLPTDSHAERDRETDAERERERESQRGTDTMCYPHTKKGKKTETEKINQKPCLRRKAATGLCRELRGSWRSLFELPGLAASCADSGREHTPSHKGATPEDLPGRD